MKKKKKNRTHLKKNLWLLSERFQNNYYYTICYFKSKFQQSFRKIQLKIDYEKYFLEDEGSNYDGLWVRNGIPQSIINTLILNERIREMKSLVGNLKNKKILDVGCSSGGFLKLCDAQGAITYGVEISAAALAEAKENTKAQLFQVDVSKEKLPFKSSSFDLIVCFDVIEHIKNFNWFIKESRRALKKNGVFYIITPNGAQPADNDISHFSLKKQNTWKRIFTQNSFSILKTFLYMWYPPVPYLFVQKIRRQMNIYRGFGIEQSVFLLRK